MNSQKDRFRLVARATAGKSGEDRRVAFAFLERTAALLDLDSRELSHRLEAQLDTAISKAQPALIAMADCTLSDSVNRDLTDVVQELADGVGRGDFGRPHWKDTGGLF